MAKEDWKKFANNSLFKDKVIADFGDISFTEETMNQTIIFQGQKLKRHPNGGGFVPIDQDEDDMSKPFVAESVFVGPFAIVSGNARVFGEVWILDNARVSDYARIFGEAKIIDNAEISGHAWVFESAWVSDCACVTGNARIFGECQIMDNARIYGKARISGNAKITGNARVPRGHINYGMYC